MKKVSINSKNRRYTILAWLLALLILAVVIPLNLIFDRIDCNFDMTQNNLYTLSKTTTDYLNELDSQGIVVDVYFLQDMEALEKDLEWLALYRTLLVYDEHECFNLVAFDPDLEPARLKAINPDGQLRIDAGDFIFIYKDTVKRLPGNLTYLYWMGKDSEGNDIVTSAEFRAENYFTGYMKTVVEGDIPYVYFLEGHGEIPISEMSQLAKNLRNNNYGAKTLNLINAESVPEDACILFIVGPKLDITEAEFDKIYEFTQNGGNVIAMMTPNNSKTAYTNLERLMSTYCIGMDYNRIRETDTARHASNDPFTFLCDLKEATDGGEDDDKDGVPDGDVTAEIMNNGLITYMPASRSFYSIYTDHYTACSIATQLETASTAMAEPYGGIYEDQDEVTGQKFALAMHSKDSLRNDSKLAVFGSAEIITDESMKTDYFINPVQLVLTTITWMYNSDVDMNIANKERSYDSLNVNSSKEASGLIALFAGFPVIIALAGVVVWLRRKDA